MRLGDGDQRHFLEPHANVHVILTFALAETERLWKLVDEAAGFYSDPLSTMADMRRAPNKPVWSIQSSLDVELLHPIVLGLRGLNDDVA